MHGRERVSCANLQWEHLRGHAESGGHLVQRGRWKVQRRGAVQPVSPWDFRVQRQRRADLRRPGSVQPDRGLRFAQTLL